MSRSHRRKTMKVVAQAKFSIEVTKKNGVVHRYQKWNSSRFGQIFTGGYGVSWHILVTYPDGGHNEGVYSDGKEAFTAFKAFIDG